MDREEAIDIVKCLAWHDFRPDEEKIEQAIKALEQQPCDKYIKEIDHLRKYIYKLETQIVEQQPTDAVQRTSNANKKYVENTLEDAISRQAAVDAMYSLCGDGTLKENEWRDNPHIDSIIDALKDLPSVSTEKTRRCRDCKYFEYDSVATVDGIPLIVAHEICSKWGDGCKTREDGYCFLFEPQESEDKE